MPHPAAPSRRALLGALSVLGLSPHAFAQATYPSRAVRVVVPNAPGSSVDTIGRIVGNEMARLLGQPLVMDNRAGAAGAIGVELVRQAPADGHTVLVGSSSAISVAPLLQKAVSYQPLRDFDFVTLLALLPNVLVCNPALPVNSVRELIAWAKSKGDDTRMASAGIGSASHLAGLALQSAGGFKSLHVPYKGGSQGVASVVSGETDWVLTPAPAAMGLVTAKRLRLLGHSMPPGTQPLGSTPSLGSELPGFEYAGWIGLMAPRGTPAAALDALAQAAAQALKQPEVLKVFDANGAVAHPSTRDEFRAHLARDIETTRKVIAAAGIQPE